MKIQSSSINMRSNSLYTKVSGYNIKSSRFSQGLNIQKNLQGKNTGGTSYGTNAQVSSGTSMYIGKNDTGMSPSDELHMQIRLFRYLLDLILKGGSHWKRSNSQIGQFNPGENYSVWKKTENTEFWSGEFEETSFESKGLVRTEDGREINFNVSFSMSSAFVEEFKIETTVPYVMADPLVINLGSSVTSVSDQKFLFDLDCDGKKEEISFVGEDCGLIALDKNGDGIINDGRELFGTKNGDGYSDLARYDDDHNGWIDENDDVFTRLKVWTKNSAGDDVLLDLKSADVGAIYLKNVSTEYSLRDDNGDFAGMLRKSSIYLHESTGQAGITGHVDLAY